MKNRRTSVLRLPLLPMAPLLLLPLLLTAGCWNKTELDEWGFAEAAAIDPAGEGRLKLTTQIYKPGESESQGIPSARQAAYVDIVTHSDTIHGASQDATNDLGRKLQWSHLQVLLINEELLRTGTIGELLEYFTRAQEPRSTTAVLLTRGEAGEFLKVQPLIDSSIGHQIQSIQKLARELTGKTLNVTILDIIRLSKAYHATYVVPIVKSTREIHPIVSTDGLALLRFPEGKRIGAVPPKEVPFVLMLMNKYKGGVLEMPCPGKQRSDSFVVSELTTRIRPTVQGDRLTVLFNVRAKGRVGELVCSPLETREDVDRYIARIRDHLEEGMNHAMSTLQTSKADVVGIGMHLHHWHNGLWKQWRKDWPRRFAEADVQYRIQTQVTSTGENLGLPLTSLEPHS